MCYNTFGQLENNTDILQKVFEIQQHAQMNTAQLF